MTIRFKSWVKFKYNVAELIKDIPNYPYFQAPDQLSFTQNKLNRYLDEIREIDLETEILENIYSMPDEKKLLYKKDLKETIIVFYSELGSWFVPEEQHDDWVDYEEFKLQEYFTLETQMDWKSRAFLVGVIRKVGRFLHFYYNLLDKDILLSEEESKVELKDELISLKTHISRFQLLKTIGVLDLPIFKQDKVSQTKKFQLLSYLLDTHERTAKKFYNGETIPRKEIILKVNDYIESISKKEEIKGR
jgi:hypothetical protein